MKMRLLFNMTIICITLLSSVAIASDYEDFVQAAWEGNIQEVKRLADKGIDINIKANDGFNALMKAAYKGNVDIVKFLLSRKVNINIKSFNGLTALFAASQKGHLNIVKILLNNDAQVDIHLHTGETPLYMASQNGYIEIVRLLIEFGANVNAKRDVGATPLMQASQQGHIDVVKELIKHGADVNIRRNDGTTSLMIASLGGHTEIVKFLIENGADINSKSNNGETALTISRNKGFKEIIKLFEGNGALIDDHTTSSVSISEVNSKIPKQYRSKIVLFQEKGGKISASGSFGVYNKQETWNKAGSIWFIGEGGVIWNNINLIEGEYYIVDENNNPIMLQRGEIKAAKNVEKEANIYKNADRKSKSLTQVIPPQKVEIILPGKKGWDKVVTESNINGWVDSKSLSSVEFYEVQN